MDALDDFAAFQTKVQLALVASTRKVSQIAAHDLDFYRSINPQIASLLDRQNARLLALSERLLANAASSADAVGPRLPDNDAVDANWRGIVDAVDSLLEKADISIDEYTGAVKRLSPSRDQTPVKSHAQQTRLASSFRYRDLPKPQRTFQVPPDNQAQPPFKPLLKSKPHATTPLVKKPEPLENEDDTPHYAHPYKTELEKYRYPASVYTRSEPIPYHDFDTTTATLVDTEEALDEMLRELEQAHEIAIDLEHHDQRSYIGLVSLMQISTRNRDWIVDTLKPWRQSLQKLNIVFANPAIIKVLHGAHMDVVWLQRDLGLYIVGLFDTHHASRALRYPGGSLAYLLKHFANVDAQKQYQMADWRIRPLPKELFDYARSDTHYLLYIFDNMRNELIQGSNFELAEHEGDLIEQVLRKSRDTALQTYNHEVYDETYGTGAGGWYRLVRKTPSLLNKTQFHVFRAVHQWRDRVAREQDDGPHFLMLNHILFSLAREMPATRAALLGICQPTSDTVRARADELLAVIATAKEEAVDAEEMPDLIKQSEIHIYGEPTEEELALAPAAVPAVTDAAVRGAPAHPSDSALQRSLVSSFWGSLLTKVSSQRRQMATMSDVHLSVPLPPLTAEVFADPASVFNDALPNPDTPVKTEQPSIERKAEEVFTLKQINHSSKATANDTGVKGDMNSDEIALDADAAEAASSKAARKAARRARKAAKRASLGPTDADPDDVIESDHLEIHISNDRAANGNREDEEAFDYASAPTVLHGAEAIERKNLHDLKESKRKRREERENAKKKRRSGDGHADANITGGIEAGAQTASGDIGAGAGGFNPFVKALDAPKGLPRAHREKAGRSKTFKA